MTRFSPEYIKFIFSDEASVLQEQWKPRLGDWVLWGQHLGLVTFVPSGTFVPVTGTKYLRVKFPNQRATSKKSEDLSWLPTLSDLLDMIEEAGWDWMRSVSGEWSAWDDRTNIPKLHNVYERGDRLLAAAKLAVRVLEEGKE